MANGVEWWKGMSCNSDCAAAVARVIRAYEVDATPFPTDWKRPAYRQERKAGSELPNAVAYSAERNQERLQAETEPASETSEDTAVVLWPSDNSDAE